MANNTRLWPTIKRLLYYGAPRRKSLGLAVLMLWIAAAAEVLGPVLISFFIDLLVAKHRMPLGLAAGLITSYLLLQLLAAIRQYWQALRFNQAAVGVV
ncbi:multidrug ABC transporter permease/ATP-binding protein, partial [Erwinia amylovora]|nr:multidrug ABC transporter permease/ATP-binding protein [Erwinia amylovora]